ncbi:DNA phosphorothioation-dependent restriction protein DptG [Staphylococcus felis]|uniref:DNA phosphorothioation-dependent restriction protein DptG n=1 Tax=Staphylococcus felis TaxID=46127 RepID=A0ABS0QQ67_9STAP|nr:DNA phosphorothioation-dependent restriction protein DptG [Staphylococcus felis]MBH9581423.1 DNA phosphorothioation-dependent restriction protein DptG [Staphylococcus felis]
MESAGTKLINELSMNAEKIKYTRNFQYKIYPFFTRKPERAQFSNGFKPIIGALSRNSLGLKLDYTSDDYNIEEIANNIDTVSDLDEAEKERFLNKVFGFSNIHSINHPYIINYHPLSEGKESVGEKQVAQFISKLFDLKNNKQWLDFVGDKTSKNLVEKILLESVKPIPKGDESNRFHIILKNEFQTKDEDLKFLLNHKDFALKHLDKFFAFYYFQTLIQTILNMNNLSELKKGTKIYPIYFTFETEKLTSSRKTNISGFNQINAIKKFTLVNDNLLGYLNILMNTINQDEKFYSLTEILNSSYENETKLNYELKKALNQYKDSKLKSEEVSYELIENIELFKKWLSEDMSKETISRYHLSIDDIGEYMFLKNRGRLGKTLTLKKDMLILLTALIVKENKMLIKDVFIEFEKRGIYFDRYTKEEITSFYEKMNILDKKSDSGEVKYVKPIL